MSERQKKKLAQREANRLKKRMIEKVISNSKTSNVAFNLNFLVDGWLELESDPGTFSLLIEDFGCFGAQVDEIYDLEQKFEGPVFGFIFLFKWLNNQPNDRSRSQKSTSFTTNHLDNRESDKPPEQRQWNYVEDEKIIGEMFFAKQMISNSCATHALISILLNCDYEKLKLGPTLTRLKEHTKIMDPENKGYAIGNLPELAKAHNSHASYSSLYNRNKPSSHSASGMSYMISGNQRTNLQQQNKHEAYHFVSYVPINNRLYELDGLKNYPIDHGPFEPKEDWTEKFRRVIKQRLNSNKNENDSTISNDIRYNLMAVVPDKRYSLKAKLRKLKFHQEVVQNNVKHLFSTKKVSRPVTLDVDIPNPPYSPLSNGTLTASETGSICNSPSHNSAEDCFFAEDEHKVDKYYIVKFGSRADQTEFQEENTEVAHKNCVKEVETTSIHPIDLTVGLNGNPDKQSQSVGNHTENNNHTDERHKSDLRESKSAQKRKDLEVETSSSNNNEQLCVQENQTNGLSRIEVESKTNEVRAHNNTKYNLSAEPPFDFNILDDMQHVHFGKSTLKDLKALSDRLKSDIEKQELQLKEEVDKRRKYKIDNSRRTHNYEPFIMTFLSMLATHGNLADLIEKDLGLTSEEPTASQVQPDAICKTPKAPTNTSATNKVSTTNGGSSTKNNPHNNKVAAPAKPKYKYVSTGRPVGRPRKNPLPTAVPPPPVKVPNTK